MSDSIFADFDNVTFVIGIDFDEANPDDYKAVTVTCKGTGVVTRFHTNNFPSDFEAARKFAFDSAKEKVVNTANNFWLSYCSSFDSSVDRFMEKNTKYMLVPKWRF